MGSTITDIYFTHEHGVRIALWQVSRPAPLPASSALTHSPSQVSYCASVNLAPIISGVIATNHGWRSCFYVLGAFEALTLIGVLLFCPETMYQRPASASDPLEHDKYTTEHIERSEEKGTAPGTSTSSLEAQKPADVADTLTFAASLKLVHRFEKKESIWIIIARPFAVFFAPHIFCRSLPTPDELGNDSAELGDDSVRARR